MFEQNNVYIDYNENLFTFHKVNDEEKIIEIDLDNCEIKEREENNENDAENEIESKTDLVTLSYFPLCISHCNITLCYEQDLPQVLSNELIVQFMNIYPIVNNPSLICGYDSLGGGCIINHLHFEFLMLDDFGNEITFLPIEKRNSNLLFETKLKYKNEKEISMFDGTTTLKVSEIKEPLLCWKIECILNKEQNDGEISAMENLFQNSISHLVNLILTKLIDKEIPHNIVITNQGRTFYLIPRKFENKKHKFNTCWNDLAGLITCKEQKTFDEIKEDEIEKFFKNEVSLAGDTFQNLNNDIITQIDSVFEIKKY
jgi:hypothetical protein